MRNDPKPCLDAEAGTGAVGAGRVLVRAESELCIISGCKPAALPESFKALMLLR